MAELDLAEIIFQANKADSGAGLYLAAGTTTHLRQAQQAAVHLPAADTRAEQLEITILLGEILAQLAQYEEATAELEAGLLLAEETNNDEGYVELCRWLARRWELAGQFDEAQQWIERGLTRLPEKNAAAAEIMITAGLIHVRRGQHEAAQQMGKEALAIGETLQDNNLRARAYNLLSFLPRFHGDSEKALHYLQTGLALYEEAGNMYGAAISHNHIAIAYFTLGQWAEAFEHYQTAQEMFDNVGAIYDRAMAENNLGQLALYRGAPEQALVLYQSALTTFQQGGKSLYVLGVVEMNLGATYIDLNQTAAAAHHLQTAAEYFEQAGVGDFLPELHRHLAMMQFGAGRLDLALREGETAVTLARQSGMKTDEGIALRVIGQIQQAQGHLTAAAATLQASLDILTVENNYPFNQLYPVLTQSVNRFLTVDGVFNQRLVVVPGQFLATPDTSPTTGTQRLYSSLDLEVYAAPHDNDDFTPPVLGAVTAQRGGGNIEYVVEASDPSGIQRVVILYLTAGSVSWQKLELPYDEETGQATLTVAAPASPIVEYLIQVVDGVGNVSVVLDFDAPYLPFKQYLPIIMGRP
jgi:tetratricopeptide (TPR) repeat protein